MKKSPSVHYCAKDIVWFSLIRGWPRSYSNYISSPRAVRAAGSRHMFCIQSFFWMRDESPCKNTQSCGRLRVCGQATRPRLSSSPQRLMLRLERGNENETTAITFHPLSDFKTSRVSFWPDVNPHQRLKKQISDQPQQGRHRKTFPHYSVQDLASSKSLPGGTIIGPESFRVRFFFKTQKALQNVKATK